MIKFIRKNINYIYIAVVYLLILMQYPMYMAISHFVLHQNVATSLRPSYLLIWGIVRILIVIPLLFTLIAKQGVKHEELYLSFGNYKRVISITFWGTFAFTILAMILYPWFIHTTSLTVLRIFEYLPFFILFALTNAFIEETFFRGISLHLLTEKTNFWIANSIQAFFFALIHVINPMSISPWLFVGLTFFLGLFWGTLTRRNHSIVPAVALHVIADFFVAISLF